jgi:hypothetical protein
MQHFVATVVEGITEVDRMKAVSAILLQMFDIIKQRGLVWATKR